MMSKFSIKTNEKTNVIYLTVEDVSVKTYMYDSGDIVGKVVERFLHDPPYKVEFLTIDGITDEFCQRLSDSGYEIDEQGYVHKPHKICYNTEEKKIGEMLSTEVMCVEVKDEYHQQELVTILLKEGYEVSVKFEKASFIIKVNK